MQSPLKRSPEAYRSISWAVDVARALEPGAGETFIASCIEAVQCGQWGHVSFSEAEQNETAVANGGTIWAAFEIDPILLHDRSFTEPEVLIIEVSNAGTDRASTLVRLIPALEDDELCSAVAKAGQP